MSMTHSIIEAYKSALIEGNLGEDYVNDNHDAKVIRINTCSKKIGALYLEADYFNEKTIKLIRDKLKAKEVTTDPRFNFQILNAYNIIYLDGDWKELEGKSTKDYKNICNDKVEADMKLALEFLEKSHINVEHYHSWVPTEFPVNDGKAKMGYHSFIITDVNVESDIRMSLFNHLQNNCTYGTTVLDESPLKTTQSLLPFATKMGENGKLSRSYTLGKMIKIDPKCKHYANPFVQRVNNAINGEQLDIAIGVSHIRYLSDNSAASLDASSDSEEEDENSVSDEYNEESVSEMEDSAANDSDSDAVHVKFSSGWDDAISCSDASGDDNSALYNQYSGLNNKVNARRQTPKKTVENKSVELEVDPLIAELAKRAGSEESVKETNSKRKNTKRSEKTPNLNDRIMNALKRAAEDFKETNWTGEYGKANSIVFSFMDSLKHLRPTHRFFKMLADHNSRVMKLFPAISRFIYVNYTIHKEGNQTLDVGRMCEIMVRLMHPLMEIAFKHHKTDDKKRDIDQDIRTNVASWFQKYGIDGMFCPETRDNDRVYLLPVYRDYIAHCKPSDKRSMNTWLADKDAVYDTYDRLWVKNWINKKAGTFNYKLWDKAYDEEEEDDVESYLDAEYVRKNMKKGGEFQSANVYRRFRFNTFCKVCRSQMKRWIGFVKDIIMDGITNEIKPFNKDGESITFDQAFPDEYANPYDYGKVGHYVEVVRKWCLMFLFTGFYESQDLSDTVRMIMTSFTRKFIWIDASKKEPVTWLYNIKQTGSLEAYPYNQWIEDPKGSETEQWMSVIYDRFIRPLLLTVDRAENLDNLMEYMDKAGIGLDAAVMKKLKPFGNLGTEIGTICKNVFKTFGGNPRPKMLRAAQADYFPMRNGWLKWIINEKTGQPTGEYEFLTDTQDMYMGRYTQVQWVGPLEKYDKNCFEYRAVKRVIEQIYPDEEGREYCMRMFASVLYGTGYKDRLFVMYGTGSDGKTTIVNAVQALLGQSGFGADATVFENGKRIALNRNLKGLASTMKAEALLVNASAKSSHDEGCISEAVDVRLCNTQEPQLDNKGRVTLNGATIKGILSGTTSSTRKIYQEATSSVINALIIMQTNYKPYVDDPTDGLKRRFTMYQHKSKFITNESSNFVNTEYHFKADAAVAKALTDEPKHWQALFYILLEYAQKNLREKALPLSKLTMPPCVEDACEEIFTKYVISVMGAISNVIEKVSDTELGIINFNVLKDKLRRWNDRLPQSPTDELNHPYRFCEARKPADIDKEITRGMVQYFGGNMYRLKEQPTYVMSDTKADYDYIPKKRGKNVVYMLIPGKQSLTDYAKKNGYSTQDFKSSFLREHAMTTIDSTGCGKCKDETNSDVYIVGWKMVDGLDNVDQDN